MDYPKSPAASGPLNRQLSNLKLISRLLGHELHSQTGSKAISLSRDEVQEIQTTIDLYIEEVTRWQAGGANAGGLGAAETRMVTGRG